MSYITFDYRCTHCGAHQSRMVRREEMDQQECDHPGLPSWHVPAPMVKLPAGTRTTFRFADTRLKG